MTAKEQAYQKIKKLVESFNENIGEKASLNETQTRREYIDPLFTALGWDVDNSAGKTNAYKEVIHEYKLKIEGKTKAPDYSFRNEKGNSKFFVEAKKPSVNIKSEYDPAFQVRLYGWNNKLNISVLTDFEEFAIYNCQKKPKLGDKPNISRVDYFTYKDYLNKFDFLWETFSRDAVLQDSLEIYASKSTEKATETVDKDFLNTLEIWRDEIATNIAIRNLSFTEEEINYSVQQTLNRIIFLRFCEARNIEQDGNLKSAVSQGNYYQNLYHLFLNADEKYNSGLFDFKKDRLSKNLIIDNKVLKLIIDSLYPDKSIYKFDYIPVEILGYAYEQFLGSVIRLTAGHRVKVEQKPEVREANGVFYTPEYIVKFIVENTLGKLIEGKTPEQISKIKILDPACGSGSFLIAAFDYLINYHQQYYTKQTYSTKKQDKTNPLDSNGYLTANTKKQILLNNIFGVDLDSQAVEVTKLSLMLKAMENQTQASIQSQLSLWHERVLPNLDKNIKCGNSLIANDFYNNQIDFELEAEKKINAFDWEKEFKEIFDNKGFDCIIGNPPYLKLTKNNTDNDILEYYNQTYKSIHGGSSKNLFQLFIEKIAKLKPKYFSFIVPEALLTTGSNSIVRKTLIDNLNVQTLAIFDHFVFEQATIGTTVFISENKKHKPDTEIILMDKFGKIKTTKQVNIKATDQVWETLTNNEHDSVLKQMQSASTPMKQLVEMSKGMVVQDRDEVMESKKTKTNLPFLLGKNMNRYTHNYTNYATYSNLTIIGGTNKLAKHIQTPRLLIRRTGSVLCATYSDQPELVESTIYITTSNKINLKYLLGVLNSKALTFYLKQKLITNAQGFPQILMGQLDQLPIPNINTKSKTQKQQHDTIIKNVDNLLQLHKQLLESTSQSQTTSIKRKIEFFTDEIDKTVFSLYGIKEEDIRLTTNN
jgi:type I restriction-modification system DNA methylase subunit